MATKQKSSDNRQKAAGEWNVLPLRWQRKATRAYTKTAAPLLKPRP